MQRLRLIACLILSGCAHTPVPPPPMTRCMNFDGSFWCIDPDGKAMDPVKFQDAPRLECFSPSDWSARKDWEATFR